MVEISSSSCDDFSTGYGRVAKLFTRSTKEGKAEESSKEPILAPELVSLLSRHSFHESSDLGNIELFRKKDVNEHRMALIRDDSDSSRECLFTPAEHSSAFSFSTPELKLQEFSQELAKLKAERTRQRNALREQVLSEIDIPAVYPSSQVLIPKAPGVVSESDDLYSLSSKSSDENLTFLDANDDLNDDSDDTRDKFDEKDTSNSESVDFSFMHSVYRAKGKHEEAILLRMKYAGKKNDDSAFSNDSSQSILGSKVSPPGGEAEIVREYADLFRETLRKCATGHPKQMSFHEKPPTPEMESPSASGSTTPRHYSHHSKPSSSRRSSFHPSNQSSAEEIPAKLDRATSQPSLSSHSSPSVSRTHSPSRSLPSLTPSTHHNQEVLESFGSYLPDLDDYSQNNSDGSKLTEQPNSIHTPKSSAYPISESGTDEEWFPQKEICDRSRRKKKFQIPITIDGRVVYPEIVHVEASRNAPLGLFDRVKSFAKSCGPKRSPELPPDFPAFLEGGTKCEAASSKLNSALLSRLTCVECGSLCTPPVAMCVWGHVVCEDCRPVNLWEKNGRCWCRKRCPQCAGEMLAQPCDLWSNIAKSLLYPCRYTTFGCGENQSLTPTEKQLHEQVCPFRQHRCWCPGCSWRGLWHQIRSHVIRIHLPEATRADWYRFVAISGAPSIGRSTDVIALPANELVLLHSLAIIGEHRYLLQYLNDDGGGGAVQFVPRFKLRINSEEGRSEVEMRGDAVPGQHDVERALRSGRCFRLSAALFGQASHDETVPNEPVNVQLCLEKGRMSVS